MTEKRLADLTPHVNGQSTGLISAGRMGTGMGLCLLRHGASLSAKPNVRGEGIERLKRAGASEVNSIPAIVKSSSILVLSLPPSREVEQTCLTDGLFKHLSTGALVIDCTTATPSSTIRLEHSSNHRSGGRNAALFAVLQPRSQSYRASVLQAPPLLRKAATRLVGTLWKAIGKTLEAFSPTECAVYHNNSGYVTCS